MAQSCGKPDVGKLAKELDDKIYNFVDSLPKTGYKDGLSEDNWEEEIEKIPLFMNAAPENLNESPDLVALQQIKYASEESTKEDNALTHKDDGNQWFKKKMYKQAVRAYTEGLKQGCDNGELNAVLYTNRAAAQFHLGNRRSALNDAKEALKLKPDHTKAVLRAIQSCIELKDYGEAIQFCDTGLQTHPHDEKILNYRMKATNFKKAADKVKRKKQLEGKKQRAADEKLGAALKSRNVRFWKEPAALADLEEEDEVTSVMASLLSNEPSGRAMVHLDDDSVLHWPVRFLYPEHGHSDLISAFNENSRFLDHMQVMFSTEEEPPPWDQEQKYALQSLKVYFEDYELASLVEVKPAYTLLRALQHPRYRIVGSVPTFFILSTASSYHVQFLKKYSR